MEQSLRITLQTAAPLAQSFLGRRRGESHEAPSTPQHTSHASAQYELDEFGVMRPIELGEGHHFRRPRKLLGKNWKYKM